MAASARLQAKAQRPAAPLWPLLCSCIFVGLMLASEIVRAYRVQSDVRRRPATFGTSRNSDEPAVVHRQRADEPGRGRHAEMPGLAVALWSANAGMKAIIDALNVVYKENEKRGFIKLNLISLAFTLAAMGALLVALGGVVVLPIALSYLGLQSATDLLFRLARWPLLLALIIVGLAVLYRLGPSRREPRWQWITIGSVFAAVAWLISSALLSWYLASFADYNATYGSLGAGIGMMMWMWISSIVILFGAQLNSEIEHQTARDSTVRREKPLGARGAVMADTVGKAQSRCGY
jgi:membrane protein implicated in regulation of membrane protease activity